MSVKFKGGIPDAAQDPRFNRDPLVVTAPHLRFYAGSALKTEEGLPIGALCVVDTRPRRLSQLQQETLSVLARQVMAQLDLRRARLERSAQLALTKTDEQNLGVIFPRKSGRG